jgi:hypothetical protein
MKIFIVCHVGSSHEIEISGVFSSIEKANEFMKTANSSCNKHWIFDGSGFDLDQASC